MVRETSYIPPNIIAIMGPTGSGKSRIIDAIAGTSWSGAGPTSVTDKISTVKATIQTEMGMEDLLLVDTPGLDDSHRSDADVLDMIAKWLKERYEEKVCLTGILYLHRITDTRMAGTPKRNLRLFGKLCGGEQEVGKRVVFVTTMWDRKGSCGDVGSQQMKNETKEGQLKEFWKPMLNIGATTARFDNTRGAAENILKSLLLHRRGYRPVLIQEEMVDQSKSLEETEAAQTLYTQYQTLLIQHQATLNEIDKAARNSLDESARLDLERQRIKLQGELTIAFAQANKIKVSVARRILYRFKKPVQRGLELGG